MFKGHVVLLNFVLQANAQPRQLRSPPATAADAEKGISPNDRLVMVIIV